VLGLRCGEFETVQAGGEFGLRGVSLKFTVGHLNGQEGGDVTDFRVDDLFSDPPVDLLALDFGVLRG
jgi:hypothetical protein